MQEKYIPHEILLIKNGELALKGLNRRTFEEALMTNLRYRLRHAGDFILRKAQSTIYIEPKNDYADLEEACDAVSRVFGIAAFSRARVTAKDLVAIQQATVEYLGDRLATAKTFKVEAKRADKSFPYTSPEISREVGGYVLSHYHHLKVDVHNPDLLIMVEIRDFGAYIHAQQLPGAGGMPVGTGGKAAIMISGGIDSPVAAYMMAKRGIQLTGIHFASPPYTSERAEQKVITLMEKVGRYAGHMTLHIVPFTRIQEEIQRNCPEEYFTLIMRRFMMRLAQWVARDNDCGALITGESLGQVASQTIPAMAVVDCLAHMPVFRPLIGMDKEEIVAISRKIDTFETSIQPYEDCCTVFTPRHPCTRPKRRLVEEAESVLDVEALMKDALEGVRTLKL
ncbi:MAG: tRNA 4-thiouridine(8) synthase ThiI [Clostridia bacterium]|nr:tRNA 4-thiouridine(8) synthase ThiI [Clostridia bacterium]